LRAASLIASRPVTKYRPSSQQTEVRAGAEKLSNITTSYQFHKELESPVAFVRREWKALAVFGGGFVLILLVAVLAIDPAFFYPRLTADPLLYYLKGLAFAETGHTAARAAVNRAPFHYVALPGVLRVPFMLAFKDFDNQLRAIQLSNILLVAITATMNAYVLSWAIPRRWHWLAIGWSFGFMLLSPDWVSNVFAPLADAPYAAFSIGFLILATRALCADRAVTSRPWTIFSGAILFTLAFLVKFTAPFLLAHSGLLAWGRRKLHPVRRRAIQGLAGAAAVGVVVLIALSWNTLSVRYLYLPFLFLRRASLLDIVENLIVSALPSQIIPAFNLGFVHQGIDDRYHVSFATSPGAMVLMTVGLAISATIVGGMVRYRNRFAPEIAYCLMSISALMLIIPSTARYLMPYQPLLWIFFLAGAAMIVAPVARRVAARPTAPLVGLALLVVAASGLLYVRSQRVVGAGIEERGMSLGATRRYTSEVASTFRSLRGFLETLPRERTLLVGAFGTAGRWKVISGLDYYRPDSALSAAVTSRDTYLLVECGTLEGCQDFAEYDARQQKELEKFGTFSYTMVYSAATPHAKVRVYRIRNGV
jgi:hypothetical protein